MDSKKIQSCAQQGRSFRSHLQFFFFAFLEWEMSVWRAPKRLCRSRASELFLYLYENSVPLDRWAGAARALARGSLDVDERTTDQAPWLETDLVALQRHCSRLGEKDAWVLSFAEWHLEIALRDLWPEKATLPNAHLFLYDTWSAQVAHIAKNVNPFKWHHFWLRFLLLHAEAVTQTADLKKQIFAHTHFTYNNSRACKEFLLALAGKKKNCWLSGGSLLLQYFWLPE